MPAYYTDRVLFTYIVITKPEENIALKKCKLTSCICQLRAEKCAKTTKYVRRNKFRPYVFNARTIRIA